MTLNLKKVLVIMARNCMDDKDMLEKAGLPVGTWSQIKSGKCKAKTSTIGRIAKGLGVDVTEILED